MAEQTPVQRAARAAAKRLESEYGPELVEDVEAILRSGETERRPDQYLDPVALASLVVSIASLGWTVYTDLRKRTAKPSPEVVARRIRVELPGASEHERIVEVVVDEIAESDDA